MRPREIPAEAAIYGAYVCRVVGSFNEAAGDPRGSLSN